MKKMLVAIVILVVLIGGIYMWHRISASRGLGPAPVPTASGNSNLQPAISASDKGEEVTKNDPIFFSTGNLAVTVTKNVTTPSKDADYLLNNYKKCGPPYRPASYYHDVVQTLLKLPKTVYVISDANQQSQFDVSLIPNLIGYKDLDSVQADFFTCPGDVGKLKAVAMSDQWLVFTQSCAESDQGCQNIATVVNPTIKIK